MLALNHQYVLHTISPTPRGKVLGGFRLTDRVINSRRRLSLSDSFYTLPSNHHH